MRYNKLIPYIFVVALFTIGCKKIVYVPTGSVEKEEAVKSERDVVAILNACYTPMAGSGFMGGRLQKVSQYLADEANTSLITGFDGDIVNYKSSPNSGSEDLMKEPYIIIQRANVALENLSLVTSSNATRDSYEGQAKFMRAFSHFELVKLFAQPFGYSPSNNHLGIVIKTASLFEPERARNTVAEVYNAVLGDLNVAQNLLPATNGVYANKWAAKALLARVYFQMNKFDSAFKYSNEVITGSSATFDATPAYITNRFNNPVSTEAIFYLTNEPVSASVPRFDGLRNNSTPNYNLGGLPASTSTYSSITINPADLRAAWFNVQPVTLLYGVQKYKVANFILPLIHITEMKFIRAESSTETGINLTVAIADINDITTRAYGGTLTNLLAGSSATAIKARVRTERKKEMIYENGDRLQEIKRIGAKGEPSFSRGGAPWNCDGIILKFPANEISIFTGFIQNPSGTCI